MKELYIYNSISGKESSTHSRWTWVCMWTNGLQQCSLGKCENIYVF